MKKIKSIAIILLLFITGCSTSKINTSWKADNVGTTQYKKILVLGLINQSDYTLREKMEQHIMGDLKTRGYTAICSCDEFNTKAFEGMTEKQALEKLQNSGIDGVLTIVLLNKEKEAYYVTGLGQKQPNNMYQDRFWDYYKNTYDRVFAPGYYIEDTKYLWQSNFYEMSGKKLLYSAQSSSFDSPSAETLGHQYGKMIVKDMVKKKVLK